MKKRNSNMEWQPIATAPKDGNEYGLLLYDIEWGDLGPGIGYWNIDLERWLTMDNEKRIVPTHWMPLPSLPQVSE